MAGAVGACENVDAQPRRLLVQPSKVRMLERSARKSLRLLARWRGRRRLTERATLRSDAHDVDRGRFVKARVLEPGIAREHDRPAVRRPVRLSLVVGRVIRDLLDAAALQLDDV